MIIIIDNSNKMHYMSLLSQMYTQRNQMFSERLKWSVNSVDGCEVDQFDRCNPIYVIVEEKGKVLASARLLPTVGPHMAADVFSDFFDEPVPIAPTIIECTRFMVSAETQSISAKKVKELSGLLMIGIAEVGREMGAKLISGVFNRAMLAIYKMNRYPPEIVLTGDDSHVPVYFGVWGISEERLVAIRSKLNQWDAVVHRVELERVKSLYAA